MSLHCRFLAIWWPLKLQITKRRARFIIFGIWVIALASTIPWALFFELVSVPELPPDIKVCLEIWPPALNGSLYFLLANLVACYLLPMALISICYILIWIKVNQILFCFFLLNLFKSFICRCRTIWKYFLLLLSPLN